MARFTLSIETNDDVEFATLAQRLSGAGPAAVDASGLTAADKPKRAVRKGDKADEGSTTDATAASPATELPTPGTQLTAEQTKVVDSDVAAAQNGGDPGNAPAAAVTPEPEPTVVVEGGQTNAGSPGEATLDDLKDELTKLLKKEPAYGVKNAQDLIALHSNGAKGVTMAAPEYYPAIHAALVAANAS